MEPYDSLESENENTISCGESEDCHDADLHSDAALSRNIRDLQRRWWLARRAALGEFSYCEGNEHQQASRALETDTEGTLKRVFDNSFQLGTGFKKFYRLDLPLADWAAVLPLLGVRCLQRCWTRHEQQAALVGHHTGCEAGSLQKPACAYWREAIEGLVLGATSAVRHARHASVGAGDPECVDVLHVNPQSSLRFGPIPESMRGLLEALSERASNMDSSASVEFLGLSEGVLYFRMIRSHAENGGPALAMLVERGVARRYPHLKVREVSARPVLGPEGK